MPMGASPSSGVAQRGQDALLYIMENRFNEVEEQYIAVECDQCAITHEFIARRKKLEATSMRKEAKLHHERVYTDDVFVIALGLEWMYQVKKIIYHTMGKGGATILIAPKSADAPQP